MFSPQNHLLAARKAFDAFFSHYPYCYGYWKKYADMERRFECARETEEVLGGGQTALCPCCGGVKGGVGGPHGIQGVPGVFWGVPRVVWRGLWGVVGRDPGYYWGSLGCSRGPSGSLGGPMHGLGCP